ncbi:glutathione S-transferase family protein [Variovorax sp. MHTC-1]|uniref:glutathione S-transferase family protein n=1 Tax=Variovorax sp. MHTC-1 TaxID=2495593 RepID=UPI000F88C85D|nr:glutathione S-transferase family protein [Variovorax sp. MHTC-1]RST55374.1 glutathione S-transferase family protein [Variovorax sp. MHTC-1]
MKLYFSETINPRKACAVARHLNVPVEFVRVDLAQGEQHAPAFLAINPNGKVPVLHDGDLVLWEANAIMCHLSNVAGADLWPKDPRAQVEVQRWLSWDASHFTAHGGTLYFENLIKPAIGMGAPDAAAVEGATRMFAASAAVLDAHLASRKFLLGDALTVADFAVGAALPYAKGAYIPLADFPAVVRWHERLNELPAWRAPFGAAE